MLTTPRGITQSHTSFIGSACQGIHHAPLSNKHNNTHPTKSRTCARIHNTYSHKNILQRRKMLASTIQFSHTTPTTTNHHTNSDQQTVSHKQEQPPTHTKPIMHAGTMCCPRHPTVHQQQKECLELQVCINCPLDRHPASQVCIHLDISQNSSSTTNGYSTTNTHNCGHTIKAP